MGRAGGCPNLVDERAEEEIWQKNLLLFPQVGAAVGRQAVPGKEINGRQLLTPESYNSSFASCQKALANDKWLEGASGGHLEVKTANGSMIEWGAQLALASTRPWLKTHGLKNSPALIKKLMRPTRGCV